MAKTNLRAYTMRTVGQERLNWKKNISKFAIQNLLKIILRICYIFSHLCPLIVHFRPLCHVLAAFSGRASQHLLRVSQPLRGTWRFCHSLVKSFAFDPLQKAKTSTMLLYILYRVYTHLYSVCVLRQIAADATGQRIVKSRVLFSPLEANRKAIVSGLAGQTMPGQQGRGGEVIEGGRERGQHSGQQGMQ